MMTTRTDHDAGCALRLGAFCNCGFAYELYLAGLEPEWDRVLMAVIRRRRRNEGIPEDGPPG